MKPGIYEDIPYEEYAEIPAFRSHDLTAVIKCPYSWKNRKEMVQTPALLVITLNQPPRNAALRRL